MSTQKFTMQEKQQFAGCYATFLLNGALALTIGALLPYVRDTYGLDYAFAGMLVSLHSVGNLLSCFLAGVLPLYLGRRKSMLLFSALFALSFYLIATSAAPAVLAAAFCMTGLARGAVSNFNNTAINALAPGKAWALNTLHAMFAIGAFSAPLVVLLVTGGGAENWRTMCYIMLAAGFIEFLIFLAMPIPNDKVERSKAEGGDRGFWQQKTFWLCTGTLFFYLCAEQGVIGWMVTYFQDSGLMSSGYAQSMASVLWVLILAGRLSAAVLSQRLPKGRLLRLMGVGFVLFFAVVMLGRTLPVITLGIAGFGFSMAGIYPTTVSLAGGLLQKYPLCWSTMLTLASFGSILMPSIIGMVAQAAGIVAGMSCIVVAVVLALGFIIWNTKTAQGT